MNDGVLSSRMLLHLTSARAIIKIIAYTLWRIYVSIHAIALQWKEKRGIAIKNQVLWITFIITRGESFKLYSGTMRNSDVLSK